jgi:NitT/TauT family transport system ATP-binding protein
VASVLSMADVTKSYSHVGGTSVLALDHVSLDVEEGSFVSIVGPNGCGKSTLLLLIAGLLSPDAGQIFVRGKRVMGPGPSSGIVFQDYALFPWRTVAGNVAYPLERQGIKRAQRQAVVAGHLRRLRLVGLEQRYPKELSGGQRQRVALARTLAGGPELLLLDEPFAALDAQTRLAMQDEMKTQWLDQNLTTILVTHDVGEAVALSDRVLILSRGPGRIIEDVAVPRVSSNGVDEHGAGSDYETVSRHISAVLRREIPPSP